MHFLRRRHLLAGLGLGVGSHLLAPLTKTFIAEARGAEVVRKRFILFTAGNGFLERFFTLNARSETDFDLNPTFEPLAPYKSNLVVAHKFYNPFSKASHGNQMATLTVTESPTKESQMRGPPGGISIDRYLAKNVYAGDPIDSTAVGCVTYRKGGSSDKALCMSADGRGQAFPAIGSPLLAFQKWFAGGAMGSGMGADAADTLAGTLQRNKGFLDLIRDDVKRLEGRLAAPEKAKLEQYLASLGDVERQVGDLAAAQLNCKSVSPPALAATRGAMDETIDPEVLAAHIQVTFAAQKCNLTHVSHISIEGMEAPHTVYRWLGQTKNHHDDHHAFNYPMLEKIDRWWMTQMATMVDLLAKTPEGNGTMLDNTVVLFLDCCGGVHHRGHEKHAVIAVAGKNTGMKGGRYLQYPEGQHCISDAYTNLLNLYLPAPIKSFGDPSVCKGPIAGLT
jgi:hypothetical protein